MSWHWLELICRSGRLATPSLNFAQGAICVKGNKLELLSLWRLVQGRELPQWAVKARIEVTG
jgi:hypothetical protein